MRTAAALAVAAGLASCAPGPPREAREPGPAFDPIQFFEGRSRGAGRIDQVFSRERRLSVDSIGRRGADGSLTLTQRIAVEGDAPRTRRWTMRRAGAGRYAGELTDAVGPVETRAIGRAVRIRYAMKGGLQVEQWLAARPDGRTLDNRLSVTKWGVEVARVDERIDRR